jgi:hypothetical protein
MLGSESRQTDFYIKHLSLGEQGRGMRADHAPPSNAEVKKAWSYTSILQGLHGVIIKHIENFSINSDATG